MTTSIPEVFHQPDTLETHVHDWLFDRRDGCFRELEQVEIGVPVAVVTGGTFVVVRPIISKVDMLDMLQGEKCVCGLSKRRQRSHCPHCYHSLTTEQQKRLYDRFRHGYEHAFLVSLIALMDAEMTTPEKIRAAVPQPKGL